MINLASTFLQAMVKHLSRIDEIALNNMMTIFNPDMSIPTNVEDFKQKALEINRMFDDLYVIELRVIDYMHKLHTASGSILVVLLCNDVMEPDRIVNSIDFIKQTCDDILDDMNRDMAIINGIRTRITRMLLWANMAASPENFKRESDRCKT
jgi:hypothetical protein